MKTAEQLVREGHARGVSSDNVKIGDLTKEARTIDSRLATLEEFVDAVQEAESNSEDGSYQDYADTVQRLVSKLPVKK